MFVYALHFPNGKQYVGITNDVARRWAEHCWQRSMVGNAIRKHGRADVRLQVLIECAAEDAKEIERRQKEAADA